MTESELPVPIRADLPDVALGAALRIRRGDDVLWERSAPKTPPRVEGVVARFDKDGRVRLRRKARVARGHEPRAWITCTTPDGQDHQGLAADVAGDRIDLDLSEVPGGPTTFHVRITDGYSTATAASNVIDRPHPPPSATIMHPADEQVIPAEVGMIALEALSADADDEPMADCAWELDGKIVATDEDALIPTPPPGRHTLVLRAGPATDQVTFTVAPPVAGPPLSAG